LIHSEKTTIVTSKIVHYNVLLPKTKCLPWHSTRSWHPHGIGHGVYQYKWLWECTWHWASPCWGSNLSSTPRGFGTCALIFITRKHGTFLLANLVKKYPIWTSVKKTTSSFWISQFQHVYCDVGGFWSGPFDWSYFC
jgi:hypothetical protein